MMRTQILSCARAVPNRVLTNADLEKIVDTSDEWITERTGIKERRILSDDEVTSDLATRAAEEACRKAEIKPSELDAIIVATVTPDMAMPATAVFVQQKLGAMQCPAFDISAACAGFLFALGVADGFIARGVYQHILIVGIDIVSRFTDWSDRTTCVLFGDGAGAAVLSGRDVSDRGLLGIELHSDGSHACHLGNAWWGTKHPASAETIEKRLHYVKMSGKQVFTNAVRNMSTASASVLERCGYTVDDVTTVIAHQANRRILEGVSQRTGIPFSRFFNNIEKYGNTSAASIPIALSEALEQGRVQRGDLLLFTALGAGFSWGSALVRW